MGANIFPTVQHNIQNDEKGSKKLTALLLIQKQQS
jgi:hypothetical protein